MIRLRAMTSRDIDSGVALTQQLHWPHRREDWQQALTFGAGTVAEHQGDYAGSALGFRWGEQAATIGLVIVSPRWQGQGIGKQLMLALLEQFPDYRLRLHATESGKPLYQKLGFAVTGQILQHQTRALAAVPALTVPAGFTLRPALPEEAQPLTALDHQAHGLWRPALITHLIAAAQNPHIAGCAAARTGLCQPAPFWSRLVDWPGDCAESGERANLDCRPDADAARRVCAHRYRRRVTAGAMAEHPGSGAGGCAHHHGARHAMGATVRRDASLWVDDAGDGVMPSDKGRDAATVTCEICVT